jgi:hypothetical protein
MSLTKIQTWNRKTKKGVHVTPTSSIFLPYVQCSVRNSLRSIRLRSSLHFNLLQKYQEYRSFGRKMKCNRRTKLGTKLGNTAINHLSVSWIKTSLYLCLFQIAQQIYFFVAFGYDVIEPHSSIVTSEVKRALRVFKAVFFTSVVVPTAVVSPLTSWQSVGHYSSCKSSD